MAVRPQKRHWRECSRPVTPSRPPDGAVTGLSPYIRHGVLSLAEVRDAVFQVIRRREDGSKLINELGWRDFWQRMWLDLGDGIHEDQEAPKTGHTPALCKELPDDARRPHRPGPHGWVPR